jgi:hypothetical protein
MPDDPTPDEDDTRPGPDLDWDPGDQDATDEPQERPEVPPTDLGDPDEDTSEDTGEYPPPATTPGDVDLGEPVG